MLYILVNPNSGDKSGLKKATLIKETYPQFKAKIYQTRYFNDEAHQLKRILESYDSHQDQLLIIGGDGTLSKTLYVLPQDIPFAYLPSGSGNDFGRGFYSFRLEKMIGALQQQKTQTINVFQSANHLILNSLGIGFNARVIVLSENSAWKKRLNKIHLGKLTYLFLGICSIFNQESVSVTVTDEEGMTKTLSNLFLFVLANNAYFGGGIMIWPEASLKTNQLDLVYLEKGNTFQNIMGLLTLILKKHRKNDRLKHQSYRTITLNFSKPVVAQIDGEVVELSTEKFSCYQRKIYL